MVTPAPAAVPTLAWSALSNPVLHPETPGDARSVLGM
jgi:hypothetical protein